jgi:uncharacterized membrane protein YhaH (DUF805 family)
LSFPDAITTALTKRYADFSGRSRRSEFWFYWLGYLLLSIVLNVVARAIGTTIISILVGLAIVVPTVAVCVRRLHDTGRSGWWFLIGFTIIGLIPLLVFYVADSEPGTNAYGPSPKENEATAYGPPPTTGWGQPQV